MSYLHITQTSFTLQSLTLPLVNWRRAEHKSGECQKNLLCRLHLWHMVTISVNLTHHKCSLHNKFFDTPLTYVQFPHIFLKAVKFSGIIRLLRSPWKVAVQTHFKGPSTSIPHLLEAHTDQHKPTHTWECSHACSSTRSTVCLSRQDLMSVTLASNVCCLNVLMTDRRASYSQQPTKMCSSSPYSMVLVQTVTTYRKWTLALENVKK